jgi:serine/threonine-protein kinase
MEGARRPADTVVADRGDGSTDSAAGAPPQRPWDVMPERYQYLGPISAGGMGSVHSVRDLALLRVTAMKVLSPALAHRPAEVDRFLREAQITAQLDHPNIVPVHELGTDGRGDQYFTMKRVVGRTLTAWISSEGRPASSPDALNDMLLAYLKVCDAVAFAHSRGVLHCDLKPDNIMVGSFGQVYVMDWGLAIVVHRDRDGVELPGPAPIVAAAPASGPGQAMRALCGTPSFMAPEQASGQPPDERTDVFGLGAVLYSILVGAPPWDGADMRAAVAEAQAGVVKFPPSTSGAPMPLGLTEVVRRAMARDPADRYASVLELKKEVETSLRGLPFTAQVYAPGSRIVVEGERGDCAYVVLRGSCVVYRTVDGQRSVLRRLGAGSVFGETAVLSGGIRTATVEAEDEVVVKLVSRQLLEENVGLHTPFGALVVALAESFKQLDGVAPDAQDGEG